MADLEITGLFDPSQIISGIESASEAIQSGAQQIVSAFTEVETAEAALSAAGEGGSNLIEQLTGITTEADVAAPAVASAGEAALTAGDSAGTAGSGFATLEDGLAGAGAGASAFIEQMTGITGAVGTTLPSLEGMDEVLATLITEQEAAAASSTTLAAAQAGIAPSAEAAASALGIEDEGLAAMASAQVGAIEEAEALAVVHQQEADSLTNSGLAAMQAAQATDQLSTSQAAAAAAASTNTESSSEAAAAVSELGIATAATTRGQRELADAIDFLSNKEAIAAATSQEVAEALAIVQAAAAKAGFQVVETAEGFRLLAAAQDSATGKIGQWTSSLAYGTARLGAYEAGLGPIGFALGGVARISETLAPVLAAAFPIFGAVALIEVIDTLVDKFEKAQDDVRKVTTGFEDLAGSAFEVANAIELQNLKMEDQIAKLEGRPVENRLKEALIESQQAADKLNKTLAESIEKSIELFEKANTSILGSLVSGQEPTSFMFGTADDFEKVKTLQGAFEVAVEKKREADEALAESDTEANRKAAAAAADRVAKARDAALQELQIQEDRINKEKALQEASGPIPGVKGNVPGKPASEVDAAFAQQEVAVLRTKTAIEQLARAELEEKEAAKDRNDLAGAENAAEARERDKVVTEATVKAEQDQARESLTLAKSAADEKLRATEAGLQAELQATIATGEDKHAAQIAIDNKTLAAKKEYYASLIAAQQAYTIAEREALEEQFDIEERDLVGPAKIAAQTATIERIKDVLAKGNAEVAALESASDNAEVTTRAKVTAEITALTQEQIQRTVAAKRQEVQQLISIASQEAAEEQNAIKETTNTKMTLVATEEQLHLITAEQAFQRRVQILSEEKQAFQSATDSHIDALKREQNEVQFLIQYYEEFGETPEKIKPLVEEFNRLTVEINKADTAQRKLNDDIASKALDEAIKKWHEQEQALSSFVQSSNSAMEGFIDNVALSGHPLAEDFNQMFMEIDRAFIHMIMQMIEQSALFQAVENRIRGVFEKAFHIPAKAPDEVPTGATTSATGGATRVAQASTTSSQIVAIQAQQNAQLNALYQQDLAAYKAAQAAKLGQGPQQVAATTATESQKTAATAIGESQRATIEASGVTAKTAQETSKTVVHATSEATQTATTAAGAGSRAAIEQTAESKSRLGAAKTAASHAFKWVMAEVPFPINIALAPAVAGAAFAGALAFAEGGPVKGPGSSTSDSIPAWLSSGEYVINAAAVKQIGIGTLDAINKKHFASGGLVVASHFAEGGPVLSSHLSTGIHNVSGGHSFVASTQSSASAQHQQPISIHVSHAITALDGASVARVLAEHEDKLGAAITRAVRKGLVRIGS